jgi:hypothetical protein
LSSQPVHDEWVKVEHPRDIGQLDQHFLIDGDPMFSDYVCEELERLGALIVIDQRAHLIQPDGREPIGQSPDHPLEPPDESGWICGVWWVDEPRVSIF